MYIHTYMYMYIVYITTQQRLHQNGKPNLINLIIACIMLDTLVGTLSAHFSFVLIIQCCTFFFCPYHTTVHVHVLVKGKYILHMYMHKCIIPMCSEFLSKVM